MAKSVYVAFRCDPVLAARFKARCAAHLQREGLVLQGLIARHLLEGEDGELAVALSRFAADGNEGA